jgi:quercetin dioxygenase-like cupin family protein
VEAILGEVRLKDEIARLEPGDSRSGRRAETLIKSDRLRVVLITMRSGAELHEHSAPGPITIHALTGSFEVDIAGNDSRQLSAGDLLSIQTEVRHSVRALEDGAFLLTISWLPADSGDAPPMSGDV